MSESKVIRRRVIAFTVAVSMVFALLLGQLGNLQMVEQKRWSELSDGNRLRLVSVTAPRGMIYDRQGRVLASNRPAYTVSLVYLGVRNLEATVELLARILTIHSPGDYPGKVREIYGKIKRQEGRLFEPVRIESNISPEVYSMIEERRADLPGVMVEVQPVREYPGGSSTAHLLGYVGLIRDEDLTQEEFKDYRGDDIIGLTGIERTYEEVLRGKHGGKQVEVDHQGRPLRDLGVIDPQAGNSLVLTVDLELQKAAEAALDSRIKWISSQPEARRWIPMLPKGRRQAAVSGSVVVIDVKTGGVLAMVSYPSLDPNILVSGSTTERTKYLEILEKTPGRPFINWALTGRYAPGSTYKMVTGIAALEEKAVGPYETIFCSGEYPDLHKPKCWTYPAGHGNRNIVSGLAVSCDIYFYEAGRRLGVDKIAKYASFFGFGQPTGIDLLDEPAGLNPTGAFKEKRFGQRWYEGETLSVAIGQGYVEVTPVQLANYIATLANRGWRMRPRLLKEVRTNTGEVTRVVGAEAIEKIPVSDQSLEWISLGMRQVVLGGTVSGAFEPFPVPVGGKTGTAEYLKGLPDNGLFVAYAPFEKPEIAVAVVIEGGLHGTWAAQVANDVIAAYFGVKPKSVPKAAPPE